MESIIKGLFKVRWQPQLQIVRCKTKVNITKPRPPHFRKALVETLCLPYFTEKRRPKYIPNYESCVGPPVHKMANDENHPLVSILAESDLKNFNASKLIAFFHVNNQTPEEKFEAQLLIKKNGMKLLFLNKLVIKKALTGTPFENVIPLFSGPTAAAFSPEPNISKLMAVQKKLHKLILMGAVVENRLLSITELKTYSVFKDITEARLTLLATFNSAAQLLVQQLNSHPNNLVGLLNQHKKILEEGNSKS